MHKKLANDLTSIAHSILRMKDKEDVLALKIKAHEVYEKLALLAYVEEYINTTPNAEFSKEELVAKINGVATDNNNLLVSNKTKEVLQTETSHQIEEIQIENINTEVDSTLTEDLPEAFKKIEETPTTNIQKEIVEELQMIEEIKLDNSNNEETIEMVEEIQIDNTQEEIDNTIVKEIIIEEIEELNIIENLVEQEVIFEEELPNTHTNIATTTSEIIEQPFDELESLLFEEKTEEEEEEIETQDEPTLVEEKIITLEEELGDTMPVDVMANLFEKVEPKKTLHDKLQNTIIIGLNDRIAFVKHLFNGNQEDFNRVISQLNTLSTERAAKNFMLKMVKPDYDWSDKEEYEIRLIEIIERRFML